MTTQVMHSSMATFLYAIVSAAGLLIGLGWFFGSAVRSVLYSPVETQPGNVLVTGQFTLTLVSFGLLFGHLVFAYARVRGRLDRRGVRWVSLIQILIAALAIFGAGFLSLLGGVDSVSRLAGVCLVWSMPFIANAVGTICVWAARLDRPRLVTGWALAYLALYPFVLFLAVLR